MATLSEFNRARIAAHFARENQEPISVTKDVLKAAVDATDSWIDANAASFNNALPVAARQGLTADQKTLLFVYVAMRRRGMLRTEEEN